MKYLVSVCERGKFCSAIQHRTPSEYLQRHSPTGNHFVFDKNVNCKTVSLFIFQTFSGKEDKLYGNKHLIHKLL